MVFIWYTIVHQVPEQMGKMKYKIIRCLLPWAFLGEGPSVPGALPVLPIFFNSAASVCLSACVVYLFVLLLSNGTNIDLLFNSTPFLCYSTEKNDIWFGNSRKRPQLHLNIHLYLHVHIVAYTLHLTKVQRCKVAKVQSCHLVTLVNTK